MNGGRRPYRLYADRKRFLNASIRQIGADGDGSMPGCQFQPEIRSMTPVSFEMMLIGTSWLEPVPLTTAAGWWSPRTTITRFGSSNVVRNEKRAPIVYWIDSP